jgi:hypothetical protein
MTIHRVTPSGLEPNKWKVQTVANVGTSEEFVHQMMELHPLVDAGTIFEPERQQVKEALTSILMDGLLPAFLELQEIRASVGKDIPLINRAQPYEDLARKLWKTYKELMEKAARLMGFKIGFLFDNDKKFREGLKAFREENPRLRQGFESFLEATRDNWQNDLSNFRNKWLEHPKEDPGKFKKFYDTQYAEALFDTVWRTIADILPPLLELRLTEGVTLVEQHPDDPGPRWGQRFRYNHPAF